MPRSSTSDDKAVALRIRQIAKEPVSKRTDYIRQLGQAPGEAATRVLLHFLDDRSPWIRLEAMEQLERRVDEQRERHGRRWVRIAARALLQDTGSLGRTRAADFLGTYGDQSDVRRLITALHDREWMVRSSAALALGNLGGDLAREALCGALPEEADWLVRRDIGYALGEIGDPSVRPVVEACLEAEEESLSRLGLLWAFYRTGERARLTEYLGYLASTEWLVAENVLHGMDERTVPAKDRPIVIAALRQALAGEPTPVVRDSAERILRQIAGTSG